MSPKKIDIVSSGNNFANNAPENRAAKNSSPVNFSQKNSKKTTEEFATRPIKAPIPDNPLKKTPIETPNPKASGELQWLKDVAGLTIFIIIVAIGAWLINLFIFRSFNVIGPSMEPTLEGQGTKTDRLIVNILPVTISHLGGNNYIPPRGEIIVFRNPNFQPGNDDEFIVKRVIGMPGERVTVKNCELLVYNQKNPDGFNPYEKFENLAKNDREINTCVDGDGTDVTVPQGEIFVVGDHRIANYSMDSRNGGGRATLGTIPLENIVGPVSLRIWPLDKWQMF